MAIVRNNAISGCCASNVVTNSTWVPSLLGDGQPAVANCPGTHSAVREFHQQSVTDSASPASLVSLYLLFMSLAVSARAMMVSSRLTR